jgi:hypothetical protein
MGEEFMEKSIEEKRLYWLCMGSLIVIVMGCAIFLLHQIDVGRNYESYAMCNATMSDRVGIDGVWFPEGYYCVWVAGKNIEDINNTDAHERCHVLVNNDWDHFCRGP